MGSIPGGVLGAIYLIIPHYGSGVGSVPDSRVISGGQQATAAQGRKSGHFHVLTVWRILGSSNSWSSKGMSRCVM